MAAGQAQALFERANQLWFLEGQTQQALALYRQAVQAAPDEPVIEFQYARALWALGQVSEARAALQKAQAHSAGLSAFGSQMVARFQDILSGGIPAGRSLPTAAENLDADRLSRQSFSQEDWAAITNAAQERFMYGVALYALEQGKGSVVDFDEERDQWALVKTAESALSQLHAMKAESDK